MKSAVKKNRGGWSLFVLLGLVLGPFSGSLYAAAYDTVAVKDGGQLTGVVTLHGPVPSPRMFRSDLSPFSDFCKKIGNERGEIALQEYVVDGLGRMQDVVIVLRNVRQGKPFEPIHTKLVASNCMFHPAEVPHHALYAAEPDGGVRHIHPLVTIFQDKQPISAVNQDPIFHNLQVYQKETGHILLNVPLLASAGLPAGGIVHFERRGKTVQVICGMHPYMQSFGVIVDNPYYAKTDRSGSFLMNQIPPGTYTVLVWHPRFKEMEREVTIPPGGRVVLDVAFQAEEVRPRLFESLGGLRH